MIQHIEERMCECDADACLFDCVDVIQLMNWCSVVTRNERDSKA